MSPDRSISRLSTASPNMDVLVVDGAPASRDPRPNRLLRLDHG
jgi:hypothetical protein